MEDIKITQEQLPVIEINYDSLKENLMQNLEKYKGIVVSEDNLKNCKETRKELARLKNSIDNFRKAKKKEMSAPIKEFEDKCKTLYTLVEDVEKPIKEGTDLYDDKVRKEHEIFALSEIFAANEKYDLDDYYANQLQMKAEYSNLSVTKSKISKDIDQRAQTLSIEQGNFNTRYGVVKETVSALNEGLINKLDAEDYWILCHEVNDSSKILEAVELDAAKRKEIESNVSETIKSTETVKMREPITEDPGTLKTTVVELTLTGNSYKVEKALDELRSYFITVNIKSRKEF